VAVCCGESKLTTPDDLLAVGIDRGDVDAPRLGIRLGLQAQLFFAHSAFKGAFLKCYRLGSDQKAGLRLNRLFSNAR